MILNKLKINDAKTEFIIFKSTQMRHDLNSLSVNVGDSQIVPSVKVRNLGVISLLPLMTTSVQSVSQ